ncbi:unnamed protein product, partial [Closterium sp. NIES-54]
MGGSRMHHRRTSDVHDHANAALCNPILLRIHGSKDSIKIKIKDSYTSPRQLSSAGDLRGLRELLEPSVRQAAKAALGSVGTPTLLSSAVASAENVGAGTKTPTALTLRVPLTELLRGGDVARTLLLLALTAPSAAPLRSSTPTTSTSATPASASTAATDESGGLPANRGTKTPTALTLRVPLTELLRGGDVARTLLLLALTAPSAAPLRSSTPTTSTSATPASASTAATSATSTATATAAATPASTAATSTPTPATTSTATPTPSAASTSTSTAPTDPARSLAPLALARAASPARGRRRTDRLKTTE